MYNDRSPHELIIHRVPQLFDLLNLLSVGGELVSGKGTSSSSTNGSTKLQGNTPFL